VASDSSILTCFSETAGQVVHVAGAAAGKLVFTGLIYTVVALLLLWCGLTMGYIGLTEGKPPLLGLAVPFTVIGALYAGTAVRRFRAVNDQRTYLRAGPAGVVIGMPLLKFKNVLRSDYPFVVHEVTWDSIRTWFPYVMSVNGIPTERLLIFEGTAGWKISVPLLFFAGSQSRIVADLTRAIQPDSHQT
jgi:hypothetical protein